MTLTGPGGVGKTRLALELAHAAVGKGGLYVVGRPGPGAAAGGSRRRSRGRPAWRSFPAVTRSARSCAALSSSQGLLVLDNAEHVLDPVAALAERLVAEAPGSYVLVTSRERLALDHEAVRTLPPLAAPVGADATSPSVRLFIARAGVLRELIDGLDHGGIALVAEVCRRLDGLPLAIELAAARAAALGLPALAERLTDRLDLLGGGRRTADRRHRTLRSVVEWSNELLAPAEAVLFRRLGRVPRLVRARAGRGGVRRHRSAAAGGGGAPRPPR